MAAENDRPLPRSTQRSLDSSRSLILDPSLAGLLEHLSGELAREYVTLMEKAADGETRTAGPMKSPCVSDARRDLR